MPFICCCFRDWYHVANLPLFNYIIINTVCKEIFRDFLEKIQRILKDIPLWNVLIEINYTNP